MKITKVDTLENVFIPGTGDLGKSITIGPKAKFPGLIVELLDGAVKFTLQRKFAIVPFANIKVIVGEEDAPQS